MREEYEIKALLSLMIQTKDNTDGEVKSLQGNVIDQTIGVLRWVLENREK